MAFGDAHGAPGTRRLLALDGGGIRGMITLEFLAEIESQLRQRLGRGSDFVLADYFDYVAGTSTGAIIAACISLGMSAASILEFYEANGRAMFEKSSLLKRLRYKYEDDRLADKLREVIRARTGTPAGEPEPTLGSDALRTGLMMVMRNATTDSPWLLSNNPGGEVQCARSGRLQSRSPALATDPGEHGRAGLFPARSRAHWQARVRLRRWRPDHLQQSRVHPVPHVDARTVPRRLAGRRGSNAPRFRGHRNQPGCE